MMERQSTYLNLALLPFASLVPELGLDLNKFLILSVLMGLDLVTGTTKAYVCKSDVTSKRLAAGFLSKLMVLLIPLTVALMAKGVEIDMRWFVSFTVSVLIVAESYSVIGNVYTIKTGEPVKEIDAVSAIVRTIGKILENMMRSH